MAEHIRKSPKCLNCDHPLNDADVYCPQCGQENHDLHVPMKHLLLELVEGVLHFDAKFFQTARLLLFRPGALTAEYNAGRRTKFVPPVRMYIFISFIFFLLLSMHYGKHEAASETQEKKTARKDSVRAYVGKVLREQQLPRGMADSLNTIITAEKPEVEFTLKTSDSTESPVGGYINERMKTLGADNFHGFKAMMIKAMSYMMFLLMPFAAFLFSITFRNPARFYIDHLVFSVHIHCFMFLLLSVYFLIARFIELDVIAMTVPVVLAAYVIRAMKHVYKESMGSTIVKSMLVAGAYSVVLLIAFVGAVLISVVIA